MMERILSTFGHKVRAFTNAQDAMEWLVTNAPDLALLDIRLRGMSGFVFLEFLRSHLPHTRIIMITGYPSAETACKALKMGVDDYLVKPVEIEELEERVNKILGLAP